jgi:23S rRNA (adenine2030-N6)-methyltransferase
MNYRHGYHAGNLADVVKHVALLGTLEALARKEAGYYYFDTHAGAGRYDIQSDAAVKTGEASVGVLALRAQRSILPPLAQRYIARIDAYNAGAEHRWRWYPGSPAITRAVLRPQDRAALFELHPQEAAALRQLFAGDRQVAVHEADGYRAVRPLLPPPGGRGVMLIDPPFETAGEFTRMVDLVTAAYRAWRGGTLILWYPVKDDIAVKRFHRRLVGTSIRKQLRIEVARSSGRAALGLRGSGLIIVNPPWQLDRALTQTLPAVSAAIDPQLSCAIDWLVPEA